MAATTKPAYYMRGGKPYCPDCAATFFGAPFPVGVLHGPVRECAKCGISVPILPPATDEQIDRSFDAYR